MCQDHRHDQQLEEKAQRLQSVVEEKSLQSHGMLPMFLRSTDYRLPTAEDYEAMAPHRHLLGKTETELGLPPMHVWRAWENTSADTGRYLAAVSYQYRCTGSPAVLDMCRRTLSALKHIYDIGAEFDEPGFLCKPYGGVATNQTSGDQLQCVTMGLDAYRRVAGPEDERTIAEMFTGLADYQIRHGYRPKPGGYFAHTWGPIDWSKAQWSYALIYTPVLHHAWLSTGDAQYLKQIDRWYAACGVENTAPEPRGVVRFYPAFRMLYLPGLMMELDPRHHTLWRSFMVDVFRRCSPSVLPDGTAYWGGTYNTDTGEIVPQDPGWFGRPARTGRVSLFAWGCVNAQRWLPDEDMVAVAKIILQGLDLETFRFVMPADPEGRLPPNWRTEGELLDHDCLVGWLLAYWEGRWRGYW